jgi:hypothetical protein
MYQVLSISHKSTYLIPMEILPCHERSVIIVSLWMNRLKCREIKCPEIRCFIKFLERLSKSVCVCVSVYVFVYVCMCSKKEKKRDRERISFPQW